MNLSKGEKNMAHLDRPTLKVSKVNSNNVKSPNANLDNTVVICWGAVGGIALFNFLEKRNNGADRVKLFQMDNKSSVVPKTWGNLSFQEKIIKLREFTDGRSSFGGGHGVAYLQLEYQHNDTDGHYFLLIVAHTSTMGNTAHAGWMGIDEVSYTHPVTGSFHGVLKEYPLRKKFAAQAMYKIATVENKKFDAVEEILAWEYGVNEINLSDPIYKNIKQDVVAYYKNYFDIEINKITSNVINAMWQRAHLYSEDIAPQRPFFMLKGGVCPIVGDKADAEDKSKFELELNFLDYLVY